MKHYVPKKRQYFFGAGAIAACGLFAIHDWGEVTNIRRKVTCKNCKRTKLFRGVK